MDFTLSKVLWWFVSLENLFVAALLLSAVLLLTPQRRKGAALAVATGVFVLVVAVLPVGRYAIAVLEDRFPSPVALPEKIDGIIALGGVTDQFMTAARGQAALSDGVERLTEMVRLARAYPQAKVVFSGGSGSLTRQDIKESLVVRRVLDDIGFDPGRLVFEENSRNTFENAVLSKEMAQPKPGETWVLITSAFHMPRAVGCFRAAGFDVIPYPVDFITADVSFSPGFNFLGGLARLDQALHEWLGLAAYYLMGRTDALFPGPVK